MNELMINLRAEQKVPLYEQIYDYIKDDIKKGRIQSGEKLPSTRALSAHLEVSRSTVELAYEQLLSEGYIEAQPYRGYRSGGYNVQMFSELKSYLKASLGSSCT